MKAKRRKIPFNTDWYEVLSEHNDAVRLEVYDAMMRYAHTGIVTEDLSPVAAMAFSFIKREMDDNNHENTEKATKRAMAAKTAAQARWKKDDANACERITPVKKKKEKKEKTTRFVPPTIDQIQEYIKEKGFNVDAERFYLFYESKGWMVGKNKMKSWTAAVCNWARSQNGNNNGTQWKQTHTGNSSPDNQGIPGSLFQDQQGTGCSGNTEAQKDYSERF